MDFGLLSVGFWDVGNGGRWLSVSLLLLLLLLLIVRRRLVITSAAILLRVELRSDGQHFLHGLLIVAQPIVFGRVLAGGGVRRAVRIVDVLQLLLVLLLLLLLLEFFALGAAFDGPMDVLFVVFVDEQPDGRGEGEMIGSGRYTANKPVNDPLRCIRQRCCSPFGTHLALIRSLRSNQFPAPLPMPPAAPAASQSGTLTTRRADTGPPFMPSTNFRREPRTSGMSRISWSSCSSRSLKMRFCWPIGMPAHETEKRKANGTEMVEVRKHSMYRFAKQS